MAMKMRAVKRREAQVHMGEENVAKGKAKNVLKSKELDVRRDEEGRGEKGREKGRGEEGGGRERRGW